MFSTERRGALRSILTILILATLLGSPAGAVRRAPTSLESESRALRITDEAQAIELAQSSNDEGGIPLVINPRVMKWLNSYVGTRQRRHATRILLERLKVLEPMMRAKLTDAGLPLDLMAVPAIETAYRNVGSGRRIAGIWQFTGVTARGYGLKVDRRTDERVKPARLTEAAIGYYSDLYAMFGNNWHVALMAYNLGDQNMQRLIKRAGHDDIFRMIEEGHIKGHRANYVAKLMAMMLIIRHPELAQD